MKTRQMVCGIFAVLLLVCVGAGVFAQEKKPEAEAETESAEPAAPGIRKNTISLDAIPLFKGFIASDIDDVTFFFCMGAAYERLIADHFTIGGELDLYPGKLNTSSYSYFSLVGVGRFYPMSEYMEKFYIGASLGFSAQSIDNSIDSKRGGSFGLRIGLEAGYKLLMGKMFSLEPSMAYTYEKSGKLGGMAPLNLGWQGGLRIGVSL